MSGTVVAAHGQFGHQRADEPGADQDPDGGAGDLEPGDLADDGDGGPAWIEIGTKLTGGLASLDDRLAALGWV